MASDEDLAILKNILREDKIPYFFDDELEAMLDSGRDFNTIVYRCLIIKSEDTSLSLSGLTVGDSSSYFKRLAKMYKPNNSGVLKDG